MGYFFAVLDGDIQDSEGDDFIFEFAFSDGG
jgi:hypothetical protein